MKFKINKNSDNLYYISLGIKVHDADIIKIIGISPQQYYDNLSQFGAICYKYGEIFFYHFEAIEQAVQNLNNQYGVLVALID